VIQILQILTFSSPLRCHTATMILSVEASQMQAGGIWLRFPLSPSV